MNVPTVAELTRSARASDADDVAAAIEARGLTDRGAMRGYGVPTVFALGEALLGHLRRRRWIRAGVRAATVPYLRAALGRAGLYPIPMLLALAAPLERVGWLVIAGVLLLGWPAVQGLTFLGHLHGPTRGVRLVAAGFALVGVVAAGLLGAGLRWGGIGTGGIGTGGIGTGVGDRAEMGLAGTQGVESLLTGTEPTVAGWLVAAGLAVFAALAAAVVAGREGSMLRAFLPACAVAIVVADGGWPTRFPAMPILLTCTFGAALWTLRPVPWTARSALRRLGWNPRLPLRSPWAMPSTPQPALWTLQAPRSAQSPRSTPPAQTPQTSQSVQASRSVQAPRTRQASQTPQAPRTGQAPRSSEPTQSAQPTQSARAAREGLQAPPEGPRPPRALSHTSPAGPRTDQADSWPPRTRTGPPGMGRPGRQGRAEPWPAPGVWRAASGHAVIGFGQIATFVLACCLAPGGDTIPPAAIPVLLALPLLEVFAGWRAARTAGALDAYDDVRTYRRHMGGVTLISIIGLAPPLLVGVAAALTVQLAPHPLSGHATAQVLALGLITGLLMAGLYGVILLLAAQGRLRTAALISLAPALLTAGALSCGGALTDQPATDRDIALPALAGALAVSYAAGLLTAATGPGATR
jgi:hypothetical protein